MKIIQTVMNYIDSQSRIIEVDINWETFKQAVLDNLSNGLRDCELPVKKSINVEMGWLIIGTDNYEVKQNDEFHLDISYFPKWYPDEKEERVCFHLIAD